MSYTKGKNNRSIWWLLAHSATTVQSGKCEKKGGGSGFDFKQ
jgi:hypothetical protein